MVSHFFGVPLKKHTHSLLIFGLLQYVIPAPNWVQNGGFDKTGIAFYIVFSTALDIWVCLSWVCLSWVCL